MYKFTNSEAILLYIATIHCCTKDQDRKAIHARLAARFCTFILPSLTVRAWSLPPTMTMPQGSFCFLWMVTLIISFGMLAAVMAGWVL